MSKKKSTSTSYIQDIKRKTRRKPACRTDRFSAEEKIRIVIEGLRGEESVADVSFPEN